MGCLFGMSGVADAAYPVYSGYQGQGQMVYMPTQTATQTTVNNGAVVYTNAVNAASPKYLPKPRFDICFTSLSLFIIQDLQAQMHGGTDP